MSDKMINIAKDFSPYPFARYRSQSSTSGEQFREDILIPALKAYENVTVNLDATEGFGSSWLDESFAGVVRAKVFSADELLKRVKFISDEDPSYIDEIVGYIEDAGKNG